MMIAPLFARLPYPEIDPVLIELGPFPIRWYALAYIGGIALAWWLMGRMISANKLWSASPAQSRRAGNNTESKKLLTDHYRTLAPPLNKLQLDDLMFWATLGVILGGRLGYILFYETGLLWSAWSPLGVNWGEGVLKSLIGWIPFPPALMVWQGGMSFHGGALGVVLGVCFFCRRHNLSPLAIGDMAALVIPIGLGFGRLANFINAELYGRASDMPWAMVFPTDPLQIPRHPSQLYEAGLEGLTLFIILGIAAYRYRILRYRGMAMGILLTGYGVFRTFVELFREPDATEILGLTRGMILSLPMIFAGFYLFIRLSNELSKSSGLDQGNVKTLVSSGNQKDRKRERGKGER